MLLVVLVGVTAVVVIGSLAEIHAQSGDYRRSTDTGYGQLAGLVVSDSNQTGSRLATLMSTAPLLPNQPPPQSARSQIQQGLDQAVESSAADARRADQLVPPYPTGSVSNQFTAVMTERATATFQLRASIDQLLGMSPLPVAGAPTTSTVPDTAPLISVGQATAAMSAAGALFERADAVYRGLLSYVATQHIPIHLPASTWVPPPAVDAPLGPVQLGATATALHSTEALLPIHQLVITAVGISPPAVTTGAPGVVADSCNVPLSTVATSTPTVLPPTGSISAATTLTNCGTVAETGVVVTQTVTLADPVGTALPPSGARGGRAQTSVSLRAGSSVALDLPAVTVAGGHLYLLTVTVAIPPSQAAAQPGGSSQQFLLQISS